MNKKGAIELSMQTIVIVIIAVVLLTGGIAWVSKIFKNLDTMSDDMNKLIGNQIDSIFDMNPDSELAIYAPKYEIKQGASSQFGLGIRNLDANEQAYEYSIRFVSSENNKLNAAQAEKWFLYDKEPITLNSGAKSKELIAIKVPKTAPLGLSMFKVELKKEGAVTGSEGFTIEVK